MRKLTVPLLFAAVAALITIAVMSMVSRPVTSYAQTRPDSSYGDDRAAIEDLQARYLFALDFHDPDLYVSTFTEDGVLDYGSGEVKGRAEHHGRWLSLRSPEDDEGDRELRLDKPAAFPGVFVRERTKAGDFPVEFHSGDRWVDKLGRITHRRHQP